jgi:hypothetical protein
MHLEASGILPQTPDRTPAPARPSSANSNETSSEAPPSRPRDNADRRREARYPCDERAEIRILSGEGDLLPATVLDISRSGLCLEIATPLSKGLAIQIVLPREVIVFGRVRHCSPAGVAFHAGIYIDDVFYASPSAGSNHLHDDDLALYLARKGLTAAEILGVRDHLQRCRLCAARYHDALRVQECVGTGATERE